MSGVGTIRFADHGAGGPPGAIRIGRMPVPVPGPGEVLIEVEAAGVNRPDVMQRSGAYPPPPGASGVLGLEAAGRIAALGAGVERWRVGDAVCALCNGGAYAEAVAVPATQCLPWPDGYDAAEAACLPETMFTVWANVFGHGRLARGERLLVQGGASGIGMTAIRLARAFGAEVFATAGGPDRCRAVERFGARAIDHRAEDFAAVLRDWLGGAHVLDVVLDMVGAPYVGRHLDLLRDRGRLVLIGALGGARAEAVELGAIMSRRLTITGSTLRPRTVDEKAAIARALEAEIWPKLASREIAPPEICARFALEDAAGAHALMEGGSHVGKIVLEVAGRRPAPGRGRSSPSPLID